LVEEDITLPYQEGSALCDADTPTEVISNYSKASLVLGQEAFMIRRPLPMPPIAPDVRSLDELESNICPMLQNTMVNLRARDELEKEGTN
jgi:hypothetical protein